VDSDGVASVRIFLGSHCQNEDDIGILLFVHDVLVRILRIGGGEIHCVFLFEFDVLRVVIELELNLAVVPAEKADLLLLFGFY
jgi:hypothetical protein